MTSNIMLPALTSVLHDLYQHDACPHMTAQDPLSCRPDRSDRRRGKRWTDRCVSLLLRAVFARNNQASTWQQSGQHLATYATLSVIVLVPDPLAWLPPLDNSRPHLTAGATGVMGLTGNTGLDGMSLLLLCLVSNPISPVLVTPHGSVGTYVTLALLL